ncbi:hypothetical protein BD626DRAFT_566791 [Schizophyllum amplum]|uniref:DUF6699 domain-containing protein n=1 Tax=Schizophyllum amplum TaxID=97359 RepID=A0A550CMZ0_9AGAR|nr:hypothetical protein BD626DRAFT_566791 [Auriculariopsis ampla]
MPRAHDMPPLVDGPEARPPWAAPAAGVWGNGTPGGTGWGADAGAGNGWGANGGWAAPGGGGGGGGGGWGAAGHSDGGGAAAGGWEDWAAPAGRPGPDPWATGPEQPSPHGWDMHDFDDSPSRDQEPVPDSYFAPRNEAPPSPWHPSAGQTPGPTWGNLAGMNSPYPPQSWSSSQTPPSRGLSTPRTPASTDQPVLSRSFFGGLGRSASQTQPRPRHNKRSNSIDVQRSVSDAYGPGPHYRNGWKPTEGYGPHEPARRPREWRPEYSVRPGLTSYIPRGRRDTVVDEFTDPMRRKLSYLLAYATPPPVFWDIRYDFNYVNCLNFPCLRRQHNEIDFYQIASEPPVERMRLVHHRLPWYIEVLQNRPNGITVGDIIRQMFEQLSMSILMKDYWNEEMTESDREKITSAYRKRCKEDAQELSKGVKRVDYLGERVIFEGLHKKGGVWEIKLKKKLE